MQDLTQRMSRRRFLHLSTTAAAGALLAACRRRNASDEGDEETDAGDMGGEAAVASDMDSGAPASDQPTQLETEITVWHQDWDGMNQILAWATAAFAEQEPGVTINLQPSRRDELQAKLLPSIATGDEGDINFLYTDWVVATDMSQIFLEITDLAGGRNALEERFFPAAFTAVNAPENKAYYYPYISGLSDCVLVLNKEHFSAAGVDWEQWDDLGVVIGDCMKVTQFDSSGQMTRASWTLDWMMYYFNQSLIYQLGGSPYDVETATFTYNSEEGVAALQFMYDILHKHRLFDWAFVGDIWNAMAYGTLSMEGLGPWTYSVLVNQFDLPVEAVVMPSLPDAQERVLVPGPIGAWALSRRLAGESDKLDASISFIDILMSVEAQVQFMEFFSGSLMSPAVYADPRIEETKFGAISKKCALGVWPVARYAGHHVGNAGPASGEIVSALMEEISIERALANIDARMQELEDATLARLAS